MQLWITETLSLLRAELAATTTATAMAEETYEAAKKAYEAANAKRRAIDALVDQFERFSKGEFEEYPL